MKKYKCHFYDASTNAIHSDEEIEAENQQQAYENYIAQVDDILNHDVIVNSPGFFGEDYHFTAHRKKFDDNIQKEITKSQSKPNIGAQTQESEKISVNANTPNSTNFDQHKIDPKLKDISATSTTEKLLLNIALTQEKQFQELKKLNYKLWSFWIFFIGLPILAWIIIAVNS